VAGRLAEFADGVEEEAVAAHGVIDARAREKHSVDAAEGGDEDGGGHQLCANGAECALHYGCGYAVLRGELNAAAGDRRSGWRACQRENAEVDEVAEDVEKKDDACAEREAQRKIATRFSISPAVKVTLFHASALKREPTCTTATTVSRPTNAVGPPTPT